MIDRSKSDKKLSNPLRQLKINTIPFKSGIAILLLFYIIIVFQASISRFNTTDQIPHLTSFTSKILKDLEAFTVKVKTGMYIKNSPTFDIVKNEFTFDAIVWFEFNSDEILLETIDKFSFDKGRIIHKSPADIKVIGNKIFAKYNVLFSSKCNLNFHKYPFDDHRISIMMTNDFVTHREMYFVVDTSSFQVAPHILPASWRLYDLGADTGYQSLLLDKQDETKKAETPKALFILNVAKTGIKNILVIFIPLFSALFLALFAFFMNISNIIGKFSIAISAVTALLGYRFVIEQMIPPVGYFTTTDKIYIFLLIVTFFCFIFQLIITRQYLVYSEVMPDDEPSKKIKENFMLYYETINSYIFLLACLIVVLITPYLVLW